MPKDYWREIPGTNIEKIRLEHPEWTEDECRAAQHDAAMAAVVDMLKAKEMSKARGKQRS